MTMYHVSPAVNRESIDAQGLLAACDRRAQGRVWYCTPGRLAWAVAHVSGNHRVSADQLTVWAVTPDRRMMRRSGRRGLWYQRADVVRDRVVDVTAAALTPLLASTEG